MYFVSQKYIFLILIRNCFPYAIIFHNILQLISGLAKDRKWNKIFFRFQLYFGIKKVIYRIFCNVKWLVFQIRAIWIKKNDTIF